MDHHRRPPSLNLISSSSPAHPISTSPAPLHRQSQSPFRYLQVHQEPEYTNEKATPLTDFAGDRARLPSPGPSLRDPKQPETHSRPNHPESHHQPRSARSCYASPSQSPFVRQPMQLSTSSRSPTYTRPRGLRIANLVRPWLPVFMYALTSLAFIVAIAFYKTEVFARLDELAHWLQSDEHYGHAVLFFLIFLTTIPPIPLYSTLITLSGYTFGAWTGAIISYFAALSGALTVFILSRALFRDCIARWLAATQTIRRVVRAIEKRPKLLFLIRLAPYPYNVMNCILAAAPTLSLRTYTICTALSLLKVIIHTSMGASIHSFKEYHVRDPNAPAAEHTAAETWTVVGIVLCIAIFAYLSVVARRAVDDELDGEPVTADAGGDAEERIAFLSSAPSDLESGGAHSMAESPFRSQPMPPCRSSVPVEPTEAGRQWR